MGNETLIQNGPPTSFVDTVLHAIHNRIENLSSIKVKFYYTWNN